MKKTYLFAVLFCICFFNSMTFSQIKSNSQNSNNPQSIFITPPESAKPGVLWMWMGSNISKEGIKKDLGALKKAGFNRTTMFSLADITTPWSGIIGNRPTPEIISWTEPWWKLVRFAAEESKRLGMDFGMYNGAGYESSGGVWITPELSMQQICWSQHNVAGNKHVSIALDRPQVDPHANQYFPVYDIDSGKADYPIIPARKTYYKDIAVVALPSNERVEESQIINLTDKMQADGHLEWDAPSGEWCIYRFGHTTRGTLIQPAQWQATGFECDKMSEKAVNFHMDHIIGEIQKHLGDLIGTGFTHVHFDSYEAGTPTWTPKMREEFLKRRGYDLLPYLATFAGRKIGVPKDSLKFKNDFQATIEDLYRDVYFNTISKRLKAAHLIFTCEPYGGPWRQDDIMPMIPRVMVEFWTNGGKYIPTELKPTVVSLRKSGQNIIEAEAFTGNPADSKWDENPAWLKPIGDAAFCDGVNRLVLHRFVQQSFDERYRPGATMGRWGTHFDRTQTWWNSINGIVHYWQRCQGLLQWGSIAKAVENDFMVSDTIGAIKVKNIHRHSGNIDIYFVANLSRDSGSATCTFKVSDRQPELWDPVTATMRNLPEFKVENETTSIQLNFDKAQSFFIVFRTPLKKKTESKARNFPSWKEVATLSGAWKVQFDKAWGGPAKPVTFLSLTDWTTSNVNGIKYFSGTAVYKKTFTISKSTLNNKLPLYIDLGTVKHIARVYINDKDLGIIWTAPWQVKIPAAVVRAGNNELTIEVTNVWANRLIGDEQEPPDCEWIPGYIGGGYSLKEFPDWFIKKEPRPSKGRYCFTTWNYFSKDSPLVSSGLLGPVRIIAKE